MKKIFIVSVLVITIACKDNTKANKDTEKTEQRTDKLKEFNVSDTLILPNYSLWSLNRLVLTEDNVSYNGSQAFKLERTSTTETAYASINNIATIYGNKYRVSIIVKQASMGNLFGLRIIGEYPNRVDAVFDIKNSFTKEVIGVGDFISAGASIESLGDGWYKCNVIAEVNAENSKIIIGPTSGLRPTITWEAAIQDKCNVYIIPNSLTLEELLD